MEELEKYVYNALWEVFEKGKLSPAALAKFKDKGILLQDVKLTITTMLNKLIEMVNKLPDNIKF